MEKVLVLLAHPDMTHSTANRLLADHVMALPGVTLVDLYDVISTPFDTSYFERLLREASAVVLQFPFYWASAPARLKQWIDEVFTGFAKTPLVTGKPLMVVTTAASPLSAYRSGGRNRFTMDELLRPYQLTAIHSGMEWRTPVVAYGLATPEGETNLQNACKEYVDAVKELLG